MRQRIPNSSSPVTRRMTEIGTPKINWVSLAEGMGVSASLSVSCEQFHDQLKYALNSKGPYVIQADLS